MVQRPLDALQRPLRDLRVSVTDRCNFRCPYCMPAAVFGKDHPFLKDPQLMTADELERLLRAFASLGVQKIRFTGGEPLLRADLPGVIARTRRLPGIEDVTLTTNGWLLEAKLRALVEAGLQRINISLDSLDRTTFGRMNGLGLQPERVLSGIRAATTAGLRVRTNMVVQKGVNDLEIEAMAAWGRENGVTPRFVEFMDVGNHNAWDPGAVVPASEVVARIAARWPIRPLEPAYRGEVSARYGYLDGKGEFGIISSITEPFCGACNRARLSADGRLYTCLFATQGHDLLGFLRSGVDDAALIDHLRKIWERRSDRYSDERAGRLARGETAEKIEMSYIGG